MTCWCPHCAESRAIQQARDDEREAREWVDPPREEFCPPEHERWVIVADVRDEVEIELQERTAVDDRADGGAMINPASESTVARVVADRHPVAEVAEHHVPTEPSVNGLLGATQNEELPVVCVRIRGEYDVLIHAGTPGSAEIRRVDDD